MEQRIADIRAKFEKEYVEFKKSLDTKNTASIVVELATKMPSEVKVNMEIEKIPETKHVTPLQLNKVFRHVDNLNKNNLKKKTQRQVPIVGELGDGSDSEWN
jgi:hypothetical protein